MPKPKDEGLNQKLIHMLFTDCRNILGQFTAKEQALPEPAHPEPADQVLHEEPTTPPKHGGAAHLPPFTSGIKLIDQQHLEMLTAIKELREALSDRRAEPAVAKTLAFLITYTDDHFSYEEAYMEHIQFPGLHKHKDEHAYFRHQVQQLQQRVAAKDTNVALELSAFLCRWLKAHILCEDVAYADYARLRKSKAAQ